MANWIAHELQKLMDWAKVHDSVTEARLRALEDRVLVLEKEALVTLKMPDGR